MHIWLLTGVICVRLGRHLLTRHHLRAHAKVSIEWLLCGARETCRATIIKEYAIILGVCLVLYLLWLEIVIHWLLALEAKINLLLELLGLITRHELLSVLIRISKLTAALSIEIFPRTHFTVCGWLSKGRVRIRKFTSLILILQSFSGCAHTGIHKS